MAKDNGIENFSGIVGSVPVQAFGVIDGLPFYFRARGSQWSVDIGNDDATNEPPLWWHVEDWGDWPDAGYMPDDVALAMIGKAVVLYREAKPERIMSDDPRYPDHILKAWSDGRLGTKPALECLSIDEAEIEARAALMGWPQNWIHETLKASAAHREAVALEMAPFDFPKGYHEKQAEIFRQWGTGELSTEQVSRFLHMREEDIAFKAGLLGFSRPTEEE